MFNLKKHSPSLTIGKTSFFYACIMIAFFTSSYAQDKIHVKNGIIIEAKIQEIGAETISYKKFNNPTAGIFSIKKSDVRMIIYENGEKITFNNYSKRETETVNYLASTPSDAASNYDIILLLTGKEISCFIDDTYGDNILYHIKRTGADPKGSISKQDVLKYFKRNQWYNIDGTKSDILSPREKARNFIVTGQINQSIIEYAKLVAIDSLNSLLLAEDAYALALGGIYDAALYRLDRSWSLGVKSSDVNFYTAQVFALMGYKELADEFWKESVRNKTPKWIALNHVQLLEKHKRKNQTKIIPSSDELIIKFKLANALASRDMYFQSIALFQELTNYYPNEYLPYIGYSITLEKAGALSQSAKTIEKAISLIGNNPEEQAKKQILIQRLKTINAKTSKLPDNFLPGLVLPQNENRTQTMMYAGGMFAPSIVNLNFRMGYFVSGSSNASIDFGFSSRNDEPYTNLGISFYNRNKAFVSGAGFLINSGGGSTTAYLKLSAGVSIMNKKRTSSFDTFLDVNQGLKKEAINTWGISVGTSLYFGRRK